MRAHDAAAGSERAVDGDRRNELLAMITHDMRAPIAVISACGGLLRDAWSDLQDDEKLENVDAIVRNAAHLHRLAEQVLDVAMIASGGFVYQMASLDIAGQLTKTVRDLSAQDAERPIRLLVDEDVPFVRADHGRHWQVISNLISNAMKFSPPNTPIEVTASDGGGHVQVKVRDHGFGISPDAVPLLFRTPLRVGGETTAAPGVGLGLLICRVIVEDHGGRIWHEATPGGGATFFYTLPVASVTPT